MQAATSSRPYPFDAVLFDMDGVIIDTTELHYRAWDTFGRAHGHTPSPDELFATNGRRVEETLRDCFGEGLTRGDLDTLTLERERMFSHALATEPVAPIAGVHRFLEDLRTAGVPWALGTSSAPANVELALSRLGLAERFEVRVTAADVTHGKPHPEVYLKAAAALGVSSSACIVVEDSVMGLRAGRAAGARCVALTTTFPREVLLREDPTWLAEDFRALSFPLAP